MRDWFASMSITFLITLSGCVLSGCTENEMAKSFGGTMRLDLLCGQKLTNVTWKDAELWYLTRPMRADESPEVWTFREEASFGTLEGTVVLTERACP